MFCNANIEDYTIQIIQGDYLSCIYTITDQNGKALTNVKNVIFTCKRLNLQIILKSIDASNFELILDSAITSTLQACTTTYDITIQFNDESTPHTVIFDSEIIVLKKENVVNDAI